eukprot:3551242-Pleurochrysis_carterae.AAC.1
MAISASASSDPSKIYTGGLASAYCSITELLVPIWPLHGPATSRRLPGVSERQPLHMFVNETGSNSQKSADHPKVICRQTRRREKQVREENEMREGASVSHVLESKSDGFDAMEGATARAG